MAKMIEALVPMAHVKNVEHSVTFYKQLGFAVTSDFKQEGMLKWVHLESGNANLFLSLASDNVVAGQQGVLFYLYSPNLIALREHLLSLGVSVSAIAYPFYMEKGEMRVEDPDGYCLLIGQSD